MDGMDAMLAYNFLQSYLDTNIHLGLPYKIPHCIFAIFTKTSLFIKAEFSWPTLRRLTYSRAFVYIKIKALRFISATSYHGIGRLLARCWNHSAIGLPVVWLQRTLQIISSRVPKDYALHISMRGSVYWPRKQVSMIWNECSITNLSSMTSLNHVAISDYTGLLCET